MRDNHNKYYNNFYNTYTKAAVQLPDMRNTPFWMTDSPIRHMVGTTVRGVIYFNTLPIAPKNKKHILL